MGNSDTQEQKLIIHLQALRKTLLRCVTAIMILLPVGFLSAPRCINFLIKWCLPTQMEHLNYFAPMEVFIIQLKLGLTIALILSLPYIAWQLWKFLLPALYENERKTIKWGVVFSSLLFLFGMAFCIIFILPLIMRFSAGFTTDLLKPMLGVDNFLNLAGLMTIAFGAMFQFPLAVFFAVHFNLVSSASLKDKRPYIIVLILFLSAVFSPPDVLSMLILAIPTWLLFEIGLIFACYIERARKNKTSFALTNEQNERT